MSHSITTNPGTSSRIEGASPDSIYLKGARDAKNSKGLNRMTKKTRQGVLGALIIAVMLFLAACSGGGVAGIIGGATSSKEDKCYSDGNDGGGGGADTNVPKGLNPKVIDKPGGIPKRAVPWINAAVKENPDIPAAYYAAMMQRETDFRPALFASDVNGGTWGLFQINEAIWKENYGGGFSTDKNNNGTWDIKEPEIHAKVGAKYLGKRLDGVKKMKKSHPNAGYAKLSDLDALTIAHNSGEGNLQKYPNIPSITKSYVKEMDETVKKWAGDEGAPSDSGDSGSDDSSDSDSGDSGSSSSSGKYVFPLKGDHPVVSEFGYRVHPVTGERKLHAGVDLSAPDNTDVYSVSDGTVSAVESHPTAGNYVNVKATDGWTYRYLHLTKAKVKKGDKVKAGDKIALSGHTGRVTGPHLHFETHDKNDKPINPKDRLKDMGFDYKTGKGTGKDQGNDGSPGGGDSPVSGDCDGGGKDDGDGGKGSGKNGGIIVKDGEIKDGGFYGKVCANECAKVEGTKVTVPDARWAGEWKGKTIDAPNPQAAYALASSFAYIGMQYSWGGGNGKGPTKGCGGGCATGNALKYGDPNRAGFDCSGLVGFAWFQAGGNIKVTESSRTTVSEIVAGNVGGKEISEKEMKPGDAINTGFGNWHHVALYVGKKGGTQYWMEAPKSGAYLRIVPVREKGGWHVTRFTSADGKVKERK